MKNTIVIILLALTSSLSAQTSWKTLTSSSDGCHNALVSVTLERKLVNDLSNKKSYEVRAILRNSQSSYSIAIDIKSNKGSFGRVTVPTSGTKTINLGGRYTLTEPVSYQLARGEYVDLKLEHLKGEERYALCGEGIFEIQQRDKAKDLNGGSGNSSEEISNNNSAENSSSNITNNSTNTNYSYSSSNSSSSESIYEKRQRETKEREQRAAAAEKKRIQDGLDRLEKSKQSNQRQIDVLDKTEKQASNIIDAMFQGVNEDAAKEEDARNVYYAKQKAEEAERKRLAKIKAEEYKIKKEKEEAERIRKEAIRKEEERIRNAQSYYFSKITDHKMPLVVSQNEVFFFIIVINEHGTSLGEKYYREIQFSPFSLKSNNSNQLPYKNKVIADFTKKTQKKYPKLYGPYDTQQEQLSAIDLLKTEGRKIEIKISGNINYQYEQNLEEKNGPNNTGFWGEEKKITPKKSNNSNFWD